MVLYYIFCIFAWNFCIKLEPHQLTVILGLMSTTVFSGNLYPENPVVKMDNMSGHRATYLSFRVIAA